MVGRSLGRYHILEPLGEGGMGRVYLARTRAPLHDDPRWPAFMDGVRARTSEFKRAFRWPA